MMRLQPVDRITLNEASGRERLEQLAAFLEGVGPERLTLSRWYARGRGCAVGLVAAEDPWFRAQGLRLADAEMPGACRPIYRDQSDWSAVAAFFGMTPDGARRLLHPSDYGGRLRPRPAEVAARIRGHLETLAEPV